MKSLVTIIAFAPLVIFAQLTTQPCRTTNYQLTETHDIPSQEDFDMKYLFLDLEASNENTAIKGSATLLVEVTKDNTSSFVLELIDTVLSVSRVTINDNTVSFDHGIDNDLLSITSNDPFQNGDLAEIKVFYAGEPNPASLGIFSGINTATSTSWGNQITWTLSEPFNAYLWWPTKQVLPDKIDSTRIHITTDSHLKAGSNGLLVNTVPLPNNKVRYEWKSSYPIAYYLVAFSVGEYVDYSNYAHPDALENDSILIQNYVYDNGSTLPYYKDALDQVPDMIELFSGLYGLYPFHEEKYGHVMAPFSGGMEHQTMTTLGLFTFSLDAHELGHQWFGDQVTCGTWRDIWINEGFARFSEYLATEKLLSKQNAKQVIAKEIESVINHNAGAVYIPENEDLTDDRIFEFATTYQKGGLLVNMLRYIVYDDDLFFQILQTFQQRFKGKTATGEDFRVVLEEMTDKDFYDFFQQWYYGSGYPVFDIRWNKVYGDSLKIVIQQTTTDQVALFTTPLEFRITYKSGVVKRFTVQQETNKQVFVIPANGTIDFLSFDPDNWLIKKVDEFIQLDDEGNPVVLSNNKLIDFNFYPNPASDLVHFSKSVNSVKIYDTTGRLVLQKEKNNLEEINISNLESGIYFLQMNGNPTTFKVIKK